MALRCAILPPVPVPYREPLFALLAERRRIAPAVIYQAERGAGWDQREDWFPDHHAYDARSLKSWQRQRPGRSPLVVPRGVAAALRRADPGCVVSWEYGPTTLRALAWARRRGLPLVVFSELTRACESQLSERQLRMHRRLAPRVDGFVVASTAASARLEAMGVEPGRIEVSLQSADLARFRRPDGPPVANGDAPVRFVAVGRLVPDKNLHVLIESFAEARLAPTQAELHIHGSGPLEGELRRLAERSGAAVSVSGYVPPAELPGLYSRAGALALVSTYEPFGATVREAAAAALPLICSRVAGAAGDVAVDGENAILVDPGDRVEIAQALRRLALDEELRARLAAGSVAVTERHPLEADAEAFERAVLGAAERRASAQGPRSASRP